MLPPNTTSNLNDRSKQISIDLNGKTSSHSKPHLKHSHHLHQNESLLLQFILHELFISNHSAEQLTHFYKTHLDKGKVDSADYLKFLTSELNPHLTQLLGHYGTDRNSYSFMDHEGSLVKLKHYCHLFSEHFQKYHQVIRDFSLSIHQGFHQALMIKDLIAESKKRALKKAHEKELISLLNDLLRNISSTASLLFKILPDYSKDETLLFFLIRHRSELDRLLYPQHTDDLLLHLFPKGIQELKKFLISKYSKRGFNHLIPLIETL